MSSLGFSSYTVLWYTNYTSPFLGWCISLELFFSVFFTFYLTAVGFQRTEERQLTGEPHATVCFHTYEVSTRVWWLRAMDAAASSLSGLVLPAVVHWVSAWASYAAPEVGDLESRKLASLEVAPSGDERWNLHSVHALLLSCPELHMKSLLTRNYRTKLQK